jgi:chitinase
MKKIVFISFFIFLPLLLQAANLIGYWHNWDDSNAPFIHLDSVDSRYNIVIVAFAMPVSVNDMTIQFTPERTSQSQFIAKIQSLKNKGNKVLLSIGGANASIDLTTTPNRNLFVSSVSNLLSTYGFDGIDIDIENGNSILITGGTISSPTNVAQLNLIDAIKQIMTNYRSTFNRKMYLTLAPETAYVQGGQSGYGNIWGGYLPIIHALRDSINILQVQLYNSGTMYGLDGSIYTQGTGDFIVALTEAVIRGFNTSGGYFNGLPSSKIAVGLPASQSAAGGGFVDSANVYRAVSYLTGNGNRPGSYNLIQSNGYTDLNGMMTWSINWDATRNNRTKYQYANVFTKIFNPQAIDLPDVVSLTYPNDKDVISASSILFRWRKSQPEITNYHFELSRGATVIVNDSAISDTSFNYTNLISGEEYSWRVRAKNSSGWGSWSQKRTFDYISKPEKVIALKPENDEIVKKREVEILWNRCKSAVTSYYVQVLVSGIVVYSDSTITDTLITIKDLIPSTIYIWTVRARNNAGWGEWSDMSAFRTISIPEQVVLISPVNAATLKDSNVQFRWKSARPFVKSYRIEIYSDDKLIASDSNITDTSYFAANLQSNKNYVWKVSALNNFGWGSWSLIFGFFKSEREYILTVNYGSGSGKYNSGTKVAITATEPDSMMMFDVWTGDTEFIEDKEKSNTHIIMPGRDITVSASFREQPRYTLNIQNGSGSGIYFPGSKVLIKANYSIPNYRFSKWSGDTEFVGNILSEETFVTIPEKNISLAAEYEPISSVINLNKSTLIISCEIVTDYIEITASSLILNEVKDLGVSIYDVLGVEVYCSIATPPAPSQEGGKTRFDVSHLLPGVYFVRVGNEVRKFIKL